MKPGHLLFGFVLALVCGYGAYVLVQGKQLSNTPGGGATPTGSQLTKGPELDKSRNVFPKVKLDEESFDFGIIEVGEKGQHEFVIQNVGEGELLLTKGTTTCQCTVLGDVAGRIGPGESGKVTLSWEPTAATETFDKWAEILTNETNDRTKNTIRLHVTGNVTTRVLVFPIGGWGPVEAKEGGPTEIPGYIVTQLAETFGITEVAIDNPLVTAEMTVLDKKGLAEFGPGPKFGYKVNLILQPGLPVGAFSVPLTIKTDMVSKKTGEPLEFQHFAYGTRRGPITIVGKPVEWIENKAIISLGVFPAHEGRKVSLQLVVKNPPEGGLKIEEKDVLPKSLIVDLVEDENFKAKGGAKRYRLDVAFPPTNIRPIELGEDSSGLIKLRTNHPGAPEMQFKVVLNAR